ncbi:MAG: hypothetical protein LQ347_003203 [Umbilicaria vellea]|nr:MAG: hypothetical protein LQ347_003203 [Umbilicaria vellea]
MGQDDDWEQDEDADSIFVADSHKSLASSITKYRYENGRRYHAYREGHYWQPNDEQMNQLQNISHHLFLLTLDDKLFLAPLKDPKRVIDIGTGTGIWAMDFADQFPNAKVIGTDLSPIQPPSPPVNLHFEIDDCCSPWTYEKDYFDFIHVCQMYGSVADWPAFYRESYEHLQPGGWIEQAEINPNCRSATDPFPPDSMWIECGMRATECGELFGKTMIIEETMTSLIEQAGFVDVVERRFRWPFGAWAEDRRLKDIGRWQLHHWEEGLEGWTMALMTRCLGWSCKEVKQWNAEMKKTLREKKWKAYQDV